MVLFRRKAHKAKADADKRRAPRTPHDSVLELHDGEGNVITGIGRMVNFSESGICFTTRQVFEVGDRIYAELRLLREGRLEISGHIVWVKKQSNTRAYGVSFESLKSLTPPPSE